MATQIGHRLATSFPSRATSACDGNASTETTPPDSSTEVLSESNSGHTSYFVSRKMKFKPLFLIASLLNFGSAAATDNGTYVCYILDGILFVYGIVLTVLYCRLKMGSGSNVGHSQKKPEEGIYTGLTPHVQDTYETIGGQKKGMA